MLSVKQGGIKYHFLKVFGVTRPGIEPQPPGPLAHTLPTGPMSRLEQCNPHEKYKQRVRNVTTLFCLYHLLYIAALTLPNGSNRVTPKYATKLLTV